MTDDAKAELDSWKNIGIIKKCTEPTEWVHRLVIVEKPNKKLGLCLNPKNLNDAIIKEYYSIPTLNDLCSKLKNSEYFCFRSERWVSADST